MLSCFFVIFLLFFFFFFFFFNDTATTEIYTLSLHDALPICRASRRRRPSAARRGPASSTRGTRARWRSEEHTSELQSQFHLVCRLLLEKKKKKEKYNNNIIHKIQSTEPTHIHVRLPTILIY